MAVSVPEFLNAASSLLPPLVSVSRKHEPFFLSASVLSSKNDRRRPHLSNNNLILVLIPRAERSEVKILQETTNMILIRMSKQEDIYKQAIVFIAAKSVSKHFFHIGYALLRISFPDMNVDENLLPTFKADQGHIPVINRKKFDFCCHDFIIIQ